MNEKTRWEETIFCVNKKPWLVADPDLSARNQEFLNGIDTEYFQYCLNTHGKAEESNYHHASIAMQATLHHALETLFSLVGVLLQAPDCGYAWIAKYQTLDLIHILERISDMDQTLFTKLASQEISWEGIALRIAELCGIEAPVNLTGKFKVSHGKCLGRLATEMTNREKRDEYNSIKHGFRIRPGGYKLWASIDNDHTYAPPSSTERMDLITDSIYGASFFRLVPLSPSKKERGLKPERVSTNWNPTRTIMLIQLAHFYIVNTHCALKKLNNVPGEHRYLSLPDLSELEKPWQISGHSSMTIRMEHDSLPEPYITESRLTDQIRRINNRMRLENE